MVTFPSVNSNISPRAGGAPLNTKKKVQQRLRRQQQQEIERQKQRKKKKQQQRTPLAHSSSKSRNKTRSNQLEDIAIPVVDNPGKPRKARSYGQINQRKENGVYASPSCASVKSRGFSSPMSPGKANLRLALKPKQLHMTAKEEFDRELEEITWLTQLIQERVHQECKERFEEGHMAAIQIQRIARGKITRTQSKPELTMKENSSANKAGKKGKKGKRKDEKARAAKLEELKKEKARIEAELLKAERERERKEEKKRKQKKKQLEKDEQIQEKVLDQSTNEREEHKEKRERETDETAKNEEAERILREEQRRIKQEREEKRLKKEREAEIQRQNEELKYKAEQDRLKKEEELRKKEEEARIERERAAELERKIQEQARLAKEEAKRETERLRREKEESKREESIDFNNTPRSTEKRRRSRRHSAEEKRQEPEQKNNEESKQHLFSPTPTITSDTPSSPVALPIANDSTEYEDDFSEVADSPVVAPNRAKHFESGDESDGIQEIATVDSPKNKPLAEEIFKAQREQQFIHNVEDEDESDDGLAGLIELANKTKEKSEEKVEEKLEEKESDDGFGTFTATMKKSPVSSRPIESEEFVPQPLPVQEQKVEVVKDSPVSNSYENDFDDFEDLDEIAL